MMPGMPMSASSAVARSEIWVRRGPGGGIGDWASLFVFWLLRWWAGMGLILFRFVFKPIGGGGAVLAEIGGVARDALSPGVGQWVAG
jgi:hypothetical protein